MLGFTSLNAFSRYFIKYYNRSPLHWRYSVRGFNTAHLDILNYKLKKNNIE